MTLAIDRDLFHLAISNLLFLSLLAMPSCDVVQGVSMATPFFCGRVEGRLTTFSKVDILSCYTVDEKTDIAAVAGILDLRNGEGWLSVCRWKFVSRFLGRGSRVQQIVMSLR